MQVSRKTVLREISFSRNIKKKKFEKFEIAGIPDNIPTKLKSWSLLYVKGPKKTKNLSFVCIIKSKNLYLKPYKILYPYILIFSLFIRELLEVI